MSTQGRSSHPNARKQIEASNQKSSKSTTLPRSHNQHKPQHAKVQSRSSAGHVDALPWQELVQDFVQWNG